MRFAFREDISKPWIGFDSIDELKAIKEVKPYAHLPLVIFRGKAFGGTYFLYRQVAPTHCEYLGHLSEVDGLDLPECIEYPHMCHQIVFPGEKIKLIDEYRAIAPKPWYAQTIGYSWRQIFGLIWNKIVRKVKGWPDV